MARPAVRAWLVERWGSHDDLVLSDVDIPLPAPGEVLVRVNRAALNFADGIVLRGNYQVKVPPPFVLGTEFAGIIVDEGDTGRRVGTRVAGQVWAGAYAEYCTIAADRLIEVPDGLSDDEAAALPVSYTTASVGLFRRGDLRAGETVVVHAAAGGVGLAATQLAAAAGARVIAVAGSDDKCALALANGAAEAINYRACDWLNRVREFAPTGVDMVFDPVGGDTTTSSLRALRWGGRLMIVGFASGKVPALPANRLLVQAISARGVYWSFEQDGPIIADIQRDLADQAARGGLKPHIGARFRFEDLKPAMRSLESGETMGKVVLTVN